MFKYLSLREQLQEEKQKNEALLAQLKEVEDALVEVASIVAEVKNG